MPTLNDVQSKLNETDMDRIEIPSDVDAISHIITSARDSGMQICPAGSLHSMGGQQFAAGAISLSSKGLKGIGPLDATRQTVTVQSGATWPELVHWLRSSVENSQEALTIIQKQTGADELSLGGALSSNIHSRVLGRKPIVADIESFNIINPHGERLLCSRDENTELFRLAVGGYGLFGFVDSMVLKLTKREKLRRKVGEYSVEEVIPALEEFTGEGATYGDFQYMTDETSSDYLSKGILSVYTPLIGDGDIGEDNVGLSIEDWKKLFVLAHTDKSRAYSEYLAHYLSTDGQLYWSDDHQFSPYLPESGQMLASQMGWKTFASLMITEIYVPRVSFGKFMSNARTTLIKNNSNVVYGTVRLIEKEEESYLRWASEDYACVIFNLLVEHSTEGKLLAMKQFQDLIDCALKENGSFYLTYHRWARKDQIEKAYPQFPQFLEKKEEYDPQNVFTSDWYRYFVDMFS